MRRLREIRSSRLAGGKAVTSHFNAISKPPPGQLIGERQAYGGWRLLPRPLQQGIELGLRGFVIWLEPERLLKVGGGFVALALI
jgi:hypothetical protein